MAGFRVKIGFPDEWVDYASLELRPDAPYYANVAAAKRFEFRRALRRMNAPVDRERWFMAHAWVNAYYPIPARSSSADVCSLRFSIRMRNGRQLRRHRRQM